MEMSPSPLEVADGVFRVDAPLGARVMSLYLVRGDDEVLLFDTGIDGTIPETLLPAMKSLAIRPKDISTVVISHCDVDHFGGMSDAAEFFGDARLLAHPADAREIEDFQTYLAHRGRGFAEPYGLDEDQAVIDWTRSVTRERKLHGTVDQGVSFQLGGREVHVWHVPGHSRGHLALSVPDASALLISDAVLGEAVINVDETPAFPPTYRHLQAYRDTLLRVRAARPRHLLTAHYPTYSGLAVDDFIDRSVVFTDKLHQLVLGTLQDAHADGLTLAEMVRLLNPVSGEWPTAGTEKALAFPVAGHLEWLLDRNEAVQAGERHGIPTWRLA